MKGSINVPAAESTELAVISFSVWGLILKINAGGFSTWLSGRTTSVENFFYTCQVLQEMKYVGRQKSAQYALTLCNEWKNMHTK
jgi:hypothetical protein